MNGTSIADLIQPTLDALRELGCLGRIGDIDRIVSKKYPDKKIHGRGPQTEIEYRMSWARTYLKKAKYIENPSRGVWALTDFARQKLEASGELKVDGKKIVRKALRPPDGVKPNDRGDRDLFKS